MLTFAGDGAQHLPAALDSAALDQVRAALAMLPPGRAGLRLHGVATLHPLLAASGPVGAVAAGVLGPAAQPVRAILFDKTAAANWALPWHQDRTIAVQARIDTPGFGPWTRKGCLLHVEPPAALQAGMATLRLHLDPVPPGNAPLLVAPGSHRLGRIPEAEIPATVRRCGVATCLAGAGDIWLYSTPILHASAAAVASGSRRVLQVDYAAADLPGGLRWLGV